MDRTMSRRRFLGTSGGGLTASIAVTADLNAQTRESGKGMPMRRFGITDDRVSIIGVGGGGGKRGNPLKDGVTDPARRELAVNIINTALDEGINYFDCCAGGIKGEVLVGEVANARRKEMFLASKCFRPAQARDSLLRDLEASLTTLNTDQLDLWQIHFIKNMREVDLMFQKGYAIDTFVKVKEEGLTRYIGITGHSYSALQAVIDRCLARGIRLDSVLFIFNVGDVGHGANGKKMFKNKGMAKLCMKSFGGGTQPALLRNAGVTAEHLLRYVLSHDFSTIVIGMHSLEDLRENIAIARCFVPCTPDELQTSERAFSGEAVPRAYHLGP
jgi:predicted aldo/keto reductase-like oxidoreductase